MIREDFSYSYNSRGYMIFYKTKPIGGAGILPDARGPRGRQVQKQLDEYRHEADITIRDIMNGRMSERQRKLIEAIDRGEKP